MLMPLEFYQQTIRCVCHIRFDIPHDIVLPFIDCIDRMIQVLGSHNIKIRTLELADIPLWVKYQWAKLHCSDEETQCVYQFRLQLSNFIENVNTQLLTRADLSNNDMLQLWRRYLQNEIDPVLLKSIEQYAINDAVEDARKTMLTYSEFHEMCTFPTPWD